MTRTFAPYRRTQWVRYKQWRRAEGRKHRVARDKNKAITTHVFRHVLMVLKRVGEAGNDGGRGEFGAANHGRGKEVEEGGAGLLALERVLVFQQQRPYAAQRVDRVCSCTRAHGGVKWSGDRWRWR